MYHDLVIRHAQYIYMYIYIDINLHAFAHRPRPDSSSSRRRWQGMRLSPRTSVPRMGRTLRSVSCLPTMARSRSWPRKKTRAASGKTFGMFIVLGLQHCHLKGKEHPQRSAIFATASAKSWDARRAHQFTGVLNVNYREPLAMHCNHWTCDDLFPFFKFDF